MEIGARLEACGGGSVEDIAHSGFGVALALHFGMRRHESDVAKVLSIGDDGAGSGDTVVAENGGEPCGVRATSWAAPRVKTRFGEGDLVGEFVEPKHLAADGGIVFGEAFGFRQWTDWCDEFVGFHSGERHREGEAEAFEAGCGLRQQVAGELIG